MKNTLLILLALWTSVYAQSSVFQYVSPKPGSMMVSNQTNIIIRYSDYIDAATLSADLMSVVGAKSGLHEGELLLADDAQTIVFNPYNAFADDEVVIIQIKAGLKTLADIEVGAFSFRFTTAPAGVVQDYAVALAGDATPKESRSASASVQSRLNLNLPAPPITIHSVNNPSPGYIFMATWDRNIPREYGNFIFILDSSGVVVDSVRVNGAPFDFQVQPNGFLSHALGSFAGNVPGGDLRHLVLDNNLAVVDSFRMKNGYSTGLHEFLLLPNGHAMMLSNHTINYDMSQIVEGGRVDGALVISIIQEQDRNRNVVFEWRNIDHIPITDSDVDLTGAQIPYGWINAFIVDHDGNILASFRNHSEIMKISRATGEVIWRMGGPRGEFSFVGEHEENAPYYFSRQHSILRRPNGHITLFDNGEFHSPSYSRAVEYSLDEVNKVATLVSEWRYPDGDIFAVFAGNAQPLPNDGWFIGYGFPNPQKVKRNAVEVHPDGSVALELSLPDNILAYRVRKFPWKESVHKPSVTRFEVLAGNTYSFNDDANITGVEIRYLSLSGFTYNEASITRLPYGPVAPEFAGDTPTIYATSIIYDGGAIESQMAEIHIDLAAYPEIRQPAITSLYWRASPNSGIFAQLPTTYDSLNSELTATVSGFGELAFGDSGYESSANTPLPYEPLNGTKLLQLDSLAIRWTGQGFVDSFRIQISTDSEFNTTVTDSTLNSSFVYFGEIANSTTYYWRVRALLGMEESDWSAVWSFQITDPFIDIMSPDGGEELTIGSSEIIRWETNISDSVLIDLLIDQQDSRTLGKAPGHRGAFAWQIPADLSTFSEYRIQITSTLDTELSASSAESFSLIDPVTSVVGEDLGLVPDAFTLHQNYPNPFNPVTTIAYEMPLNSAVEVNIYDIRGKKVRTLLEGFQTAGFHTVEFDASNLSSGVYVYELKVGQFTRAKKLLLLK